MSLSELTDRNAVLKAIEEYDKLGREGFLKKYGFGPARQYFLIHNGARYDSKAIAGVAHKYQFPNEGPLQPAEFSGGENTVVRKLRDLGFEVQAEGDDTREGKFWALCANPKRYNIAEAVKQLDYDLWTTARSDIRARDRVVIWQTLDKNGNRGVVALGEVVEDPEIQADDSPYWVKREEGALPAPRAKVRYIAGATIVGG